MDVKTLARKVNSSKDFNKTYRGVARNNLKSSSGFACKQNWGVLDVVEINENLFIVKTKESLVFNQSHRACDKSFVKEMLGCQEQHGLSNTELFNLFKFSRNTIIKGQKYLKKNKTN